MPDILHRVGIKTSPEKLFGALSTTDGLSHWWVVNTKGDPKLGGIIDFGFVDMKVIELKPNTLVKWKCIRGPQEWMDTEITFQLKPEADQTTVMFTHAKWKDPVEFMHHCSTKWAVFLLSLKDLLEKGEGHPHPHDVKIHIND